MPMLPFLGGGEGQGTYMGKRSRPHVFSYMYYQ